MSLYESLLERMEGYEYSNYFVTLCPFHSDHTPSFFVYAEDGRFRCAACNKTGTLKYLDTYLGARFRPSRSFDTASNILPQWKKWEQEFGNVEGIARHAHQTLKKFPQFQSYYKKRQCEKFIDTGVLGYRDGWACIPVFSDCGRIIDLVVRAVKGKGDTRYVVKPDANKLRPLFVPNWGRVKSSEVVYVVYGIFDAISLELIGLPVVTGITGKSLSAEHLLPLGKRLVILPDYHEDRDAHKLANTLGWRAKVKELSYPDDAKDPDDVRVKYGNDVLRNLIGDKQ